MAKDRGNPTKADKPLYMSEDKPIRPIGVTEIVLTVMLLMALLVAADYLGIIELKQTQGL